MYERRSRRRSRSAMTTSPRWRSAASAGIGSSLCGGLGRRPAQPAKLLADRLLRHAHGRSDLAMALALTRGGCRRGGRARGRGGAGPPGSRQGARARPVRRPRTGAGSGARCARSARPVGASAVEGPIDTPWNTTDVRITDPGGHRLVLAVQRAVPDPELAARMREMLERGRR